MLKIHHLICSGLDIHKNLLVATIGTTNKKNRLTSYVQKEFSTYNFDLINLKNWLIENNCFEICLESTGKYWIPVFNILEEDDRFHIVLVHPKYVKAIKGKKTDKKDSKWICDLFKHDLVKGSFIPPKDIRELRDLCRYRFKLICMRSGERNRYQNCMTVSNITLASAVSDPFGKTAQSIMNEVISTDVIDEDKIRKLIHGGCKKKDEIIESLKHSHIEPDQRFKMNEIQSHLEELDTHIKAVEVEIIKRASKYFDDFLHITELDGIQLMSAILIISEIGINMTQFESDKQLCCWSGLTPGNNESAQKKKSVRITKAGQYLKPLLVQCALASTKTKGGYFETKYRKIKKRRGHKKAIIAVARMMLVSIYHMILTGEKFNPSDYESFKNPKEQKEKTNYTVESAIEYLISQGIDISGIKDIPKPI